VINAASEFEAGTRRAASRDLDHEDRRANSSATLTGHGLTGICPPGHCLIMRILVLNADYPRFLNWFYQRRPELENTSYVTQMAARNASLFGVADFYSKGFSALGHPAAEIHVNNPYLQAAWAREHGMTLKMAELSNARPRGTLPAWVSRAVRPFKPMLRPLARKIGLSPKLGKQDESILFAQIEDFKPDLVLNQDIFHVDTSVVRRIKGVGKPILIGQIGILPPRGEDWTAYDLMISQLPSVVQWFKSLGVPSGVCHLAFEPAILDALPKAPEVDIDVSFVGTVSADHRQRIDFLEAVAARYALKLWANLQGLPASSPLHRCLQGEVWGADMYQVLRRSRITLNSHIDIASREAGNMRLFEASGVGAFLLTDFKDNLGTLFEPNRDVVAWRSVDDCFKAIDHYLGDDKSRVAIAQAGQARTIAQHTYRHRVGKILGFVDNIRLRQ
jgi:spore maturation protein CgeB